MNHYVSKRRRNPFAGTNMPLPPSISSIGNEIKRPPISLPKVNIPEPVEDTAIRFSEFRTLRAGRDAWQEINKAETFEAWRHIGAALAIGKAHALKATGANRAMGQNYCRAFSEWTKANGFFSMRPSDRSHAIALHENIRAITAWRDGLPESKRRRLVGAQANVKRWRQSLGLKDQQSRSKRPPHEYPGDLQRDAIAHWRQFCACLEAMPPDQAAYLWRLTVSATMPPMA